MSNSIQHVIDGKQKAQTIRITACMNAKKVNGATYCMSIPQQNGNVQDQIQEKHWHISPPEHPFSSKASFQKLQCKT